jgi:hypothetical protein
MYLARNRNSWSAVGWYPRLIQSLVPRFNVTRLHYNYRGSFSQCRTFSRKLETEQTRNNNASIDVYSKRPCDSWVSVLFPFKTDIDLRAQYTNMLGDVLIGKLFENFDALAASIGYRHAEA